MNPATLIDKRLGTSYQVIKEVHAALTQIAYLADNLTLLTPREIELRESDDFKYLQWRREGDTTWVNLVSLEDLAKALVIPVGTTFGIPEPVSAAKAYARTKGSWIEALEADRLGAIDGVASLGSDGKVPADQLPIIPDPQVPADWNATQGAARILNKPTLFSGKYADLEGTPDIPDPQVPADWNAAAGPTRILNKPDVVLASQVGQANGLATLGADGKVLPAQLPVSSGSGSGGFTPLKIAAGTTFHVPADNQAFLRMAVTVEGNLLLDGYLIEV